jgi:hypothetical protein
LDDQLVVVVSKGVVQVVKHLRLTGVTGCRKDSLRAEARRGFFEARHLDGSELATDALDCSRQQPVLEGRALAVARQLCVTPAAFADYPLRDQTRRENAVESLLRKTKAFGRAVGDIAEFW